MFVFFSYSAQLSTLIKNFGQVKENGVMSLKLTKVRGQTCHLCIEKLFAQKGLLIFVCVLSFCRPRE